MYRNHLINGKFLHNLNGWTSTGNSVYSSGDGNDHYGVAVLPVGGSIEQNFSVEGARLYTLSISIHSLSGTLNDDSVTVTIYDGDDNLVVNDEVHATDGHWTDNTYTIGLAEGTNYSVVIENNSAGADVHIDDVWIWFVPITRAAVASAVAYKLGRIATERALSDVSDGALTEGDYTQAIDAALRTIGAIDEETGVPAIRYVDSETVQTLIDGAYREMLEKLQADYAIEVDTSIGQYNQRLSQKAAMIGELMGSGKSTSGQSAGGAIVQRKITYD